jgi:hypothetical protein
MNEGVEHAPRSLRQAISGRDIEFRKDTDFTD